MGGTARYTGRNLRYYDPGTNPQPRNHWKWDSPRKRFPKRPSAADRARMERAEAKRARKAAKRLGWSGKQAAPRRAA